MAKNWPAIAGDRDAGSTPGLGRSSGEGNGNPLQCSCPGNLMDREAWQAKSSGVTKESDTTQRLNSNIAFEGFKPRLHIGKKAKLLGRVRLL